MDRAFQRNYTLYKGSTFAKSILLSEIYYDVDITKTYSVSGGAKLKSDPSKNFPLIGGVNPETGILIFSVDEEDISSINNFGEYDYAVDIACDGDINTALEGIIYVKDDVSFIE